jgi:hypothetical protein
MEIRAEATVLLMRPPLREWQEVIHKLHRIGCTKHARRLEDSLLSLQRSNLPCEQGSPVDFPQE